VEDVEKMLPAICAVEKGENFMVLDTYAPDAEDLAGIQIMHVQ
jgi:hypothetical protein